MSLSEVSTVSEEGQSSLLVVARTAPASEDGVQLGGVKRPRVLTVRIAREPAEASGAIEEPRPRQAATRLADGERGDERAVRRRVLLHQALQGFRHPMDGMGWQYPKSVRQLLIGNEELALREAFEKCTRPCMRRHRIVLSKDSALSAATATKLASCLLHLSIMGIGNPNEQFSLHLIQDAQPVRFLSHVQRVEKQLRFNRGTSRGARVTTSIGDRTISESAGRGSV